MISIPDSFARTVVGVHREKGEQWLRQFAELAAYCEAKWSLTIFQPFPLSYNFVAPAVRKDGSEAVIKLGVPCAELSCEIAALRYYSGEGAVKLWDADEQRGILLLERLLPGQTLHTVADEADAVRCAAGVIRAYTAPAPPASGFPTVRDRAQGLSKLRAHFRGGTGPLPEYLVQQAELLFAKLNDSPGKLYLLHGDFHHGNILSAKRSPWLAIDPKGVIGELEYEIIPFLMNHLPDGTDEAIQIIRKRIDLFTAELGLERSKVLDYAFSHSVLSAWWHVEDRTDGLDAALRLSEAFSLLRSE